MTKTVAFLAEQAAQNLSHEESRIGGYAYRIIRKQSKRIFEMRSPTLKDADPENLHQMRVATRRLRSALDLFSDEIVLEANSRKSASTAKLVKKLTRALGKVRDIDVMQQWFEQILTSKPDADAANTDPSSNAIAISKKEKKVVKKLLKTLKKRRKKQFAKLEKALKGSSYKKLARQIKQWLKQPVFRPVAEQSVEDNAVQRIIDPLTELIEHPGWLLMTRKKGNQAVPVKNITLDSLNQQLEKDGQQLHDLRKQIKQVRYQTEFFRGIYGIKYAAQVREFREIQQILGQLQDQMVVSDFLAKELGDDWASQLTSIQTAFQSSRVDLWQQWQHYQQKYLKLRGQLPNAEIAA